MDTPLDMLAIGDITTDAFIEVKDVRIDTEPDKADFGNNELCFRLGDKIEYEEMIEVRAVGNSSNAAVSARRLGLSSALYSNIGEDMNGKACLEALENEHIDTRLIVKHADIPTNYHYVLRYGAERTILVKHRAYPYAFPDLAAAPKWMYLSSVGKDSVDLHNQIADYLNAHPETKLAFQPGTFQMELGVDTLKRIYEESDIFFCNREEAKRILATQDSDITLLLHAMRKLGPQLVVITDGPDGAYAYDGREIWQMPIYPDPAPPVDRTGAGDSFSSTFTAAIVLGKSVPEALSWGPINSMSVVQHVGAREGLLSREKLESYLAAAPENYNPVQLQ